MKLGVVVPNTGAASGSMPGLARLAEALGFQSLWFADHVVGVRSFQPVYGPLWLDAPTCAAWAAASTSTIRIGTGLVAPYRNPVLAAKVVATIDQLSGGRFEVTVNSGWSRAEHHALGVGEQFDQRGEVTDEALDLMLRCWAGGEFGWDGKHFPVRRIEFAPTPRQAPKHLLRIGGHSSASLRRAARLDATWQPFGLAADEIERLARRTAEQTGVDVRRSVLVKVNPGDIGALPALLAGYESAGCIDVVLDVVTADEAELGESFGRIAASSPELLVAGTDVAGAGS